MGMLFKILLVVLIIVGVWKGRQWLQRAVARAEVGSGKRSKGDNSPAGVQDMVRCSVCGTYTTAASGPCGRQDCPRR